MSLQYTHNFISVSCSWKPLMDAITQSWTFNGTPLLTIRKNPEVDDAYLISLTTYDHWLLKSTPQRSITRMISDLDPNPNPNRVSSLRSDSVSSRWIKKQGIVVMLESTRPFTMTRGGKIYPNLFTHPNIFTYPNPPNY